MARNIKAISKMVNLMVKDYIINITISLFIKVCLKIIFIMELVSIIGKMGHIIRVNMKMEINMEMVNM
jgi:hypothetical protein